MIVSEILDVIYGLFNSMQVVMDGAYRLIIYNNCLRGTNTNLADGKAPTDGIRRSLGASG